MTVRAFRTESCDWVVCVVFSESAGAARTSTLLSAIDAGLDMTYSDVTVRRSPAHDHLVEALKPRTTYGLDYLAELQAPTVGVWP